MRGVVSVMLLGVLVTLASCGDGVRTDPKPKSSGYIAANHIIYMMQENRSFDHYFGQINSYRQSQGLSTDVDGTPPDAAQIGFDGTTIFTPFHLNSKCVENLSPYWNESHKDRNFGAPTSDTAMMDGFARSAGNNTRNSVPVGFDVNGQRIMGYYDSTDLPYYYFMATQF